MYRIERCLAEQTKEQDEDVLEVSESRLELSGVSGELIDGEIHLRSRNGQLMHVFFYSDH